MLYNNKIWNEDINVVMNTISELDQLAGHSVLITGATGLICSSVVDILLKYNDTHGPKIQIFAAGRSLDKMRARFGKMIYRDDFHFIVYDSTKMDNILYPDIDYIIHGASNAYPSAIIAEPVETMLSNYMGIHFLLDYATKNKVKRVLYISSSEIYGKKEVSEPIKENQYGYIDLLNPRSSYSVGKRASETLCVSYSHEFGIDTVIVRPGHIYGPTASTQDNRVASVWSYSAAQGKDIIMKSEGNQIRSYCYCLDCASAILTVLIKGEKCHAYNISNPNSILSIRSVAEILAKNGGVQLRMEMPSDKERKGFNPMQNSSLESERLIELGWKGCFDPKTGFEHTVQILRDCS